MKYYCLGCRVKQEVYSQFAARAQEARISPAEFLRGLVMRELNNSGINAHVEGKA